MCGKELALRVNDCDLVHRFDDAGEYMDEHAGFDEVRDQEPRKQGDADPTNCCFAE
jgi:hypothetical protein